MRIPYEYNHFIYVDYHPTVPWAIGFVALSPFNECFFWDEINISPRVNTTLEIAYEIAKTAGHYRFNMFNPIDPLAKAQQGHSKDEETKMTKSTVQDLNGYLSDFHKQGICESIYFTTADTKGTRGRESLRARFKNSIICKTPFNNESEKYIGNEDVVNIKKDRYLPTVWIFDKCRQIRASFKNWREEKGKPVQAYSHHCTGAEFLMKDARFRPPALLADKIKERKKVQYFRPR